MTSYRRAWAEIDLDALAHNVTLLRRIVAPSALCAVVKADAYGHGALAVAQRALQAGASYLAVALVEEGVALREGGVEAPVLLLSEPPAAGWEAAAAHRLTPTLYTREGLEQAELAAKSTGRVLGVHLKLDTGMHRVGLAASELLHLASEVAASPALVLEGLWTHFSVADEPGDPFTAAQLARLFAGRDELAAAGIVPGLLHAANSAGALAHPESRLDLVRCGIALYGVVPSASVAPFLGAGAALRPVLSLRAEVHLVRELSAGERPSYGRRYELARDSFVATVPLGYADGVPRAYFSSGGEVLIGGRRRRLAGNVTMDQLVVDLGGDSSVRAGDEVVLIGAQGEAEITAEEWAQRLGTIAYEVLLGLGPRVPRRTLGCAPGGAASEAPHSKRG
jgi:alanine racemase